MMINKSRIKNIIKILKPVLFQLCFLLLSVTTFSIIWAKNTYANLNFDEIVFHLTSPLEGVDSGIMRTYYNKALFPAIGIWLAEMLLFILPLKNKIRFRFQIMREHFEIGLLPLRLSAFSWGLIFILWGGSILVSADRSFSFVQYLLDQFHHSSFIEKNYVAADSVKISFPEKKRNLIMIYMESMETSLQDKASGGIMETNYIPELTKLAAENVSFSQNEQITGAHVTPGSSWTIAGLVSENSGVPLKKAGNHSGASVSKNAMLAGVDDLGDVLEGAGYKNIFMAGSNFGFGGRDLYFSQHGNYEIWDYNTARELGKIAPDYKVWWGFEDAKLYEFAREKLTELTVSGEPFNLSLLTVDTHFPAGYACSLCDNIYSQQYSNVYACASRQVSAFIEWIQQQDFYDNTTIVICGDHLSMDNGFFSSDINGNSRFVYQAFIHSAVEPVAVKNRRFTTLDMYPSILGSLGVTIEGNRLGLGTNLFSDTPTLSEEFDYERLDDELSRKSNYYDKTLMIKK